MPDENKAPEVPPVETPTFQAPILEEATVGLVPTAELAAPQPASLAPKKKKRRIIAAIIIGAFCLLSGGTATAYTLWYQNPEKVVLEAVASLMQQTTSTHKITIDVASKDVTAKITIDAKLAQTPASQADVAASVKYGDTVFNVKGSTMSDKDGNLYFKLSNVKSTVAQLVDASTDLGAFNELIAKVEGRWIRLSSDDLKSFSEDYSKTKDCSAKALQSLDDKAVKKEITNVYMQNKFMIVGDKIGTKTINGIASLGYAVTLDQTKAKAFYVALGQTTVGKSLTACDSSFDFKAAAEDAATTSSKTTSEIHVWSSRFGHQLTQLEVNLKEDGTTTTLVWNPIFVKGVTVDTPATTLSISELTTDLEHAYSKFYSSAYSNAPSVTPLL